MTALHKLDNGEELSWAISSDGWWLALWSNNLQRTPKKRRFHSSTFWKPVQGARAWHTCCIGLSDLHENAIVVSMDGVRLTSHLKGFHVLRSDGHKGWRAVLAIRKNVPRGPCHSSPGGSGWRTRRCVDAHVVQVG